MTPPASTASVHPAGRAPARLCDRGTRRADVDHGRCRRGCREGAAPELIENIRQLTMAAAKFDRNRGDKLTIMTASFRERRDQRSAEQIMLKNIAEKIDILEQPPLCVTQS